MKSFLFLLLFAVTSAAVAQPATGEFSKYVTGDTVKYVAAIDTLIKKIVKDSSSYRRILVEKDEQIERAYYIQDSSKNSPTKELRVVQARYLSDTSIVIIEWFFDKEQMIYSQQQWINIDTKKLEQTFKMYLKEESLIAWISSKKGAYDPASVEFQELSMGMREYSKQLKAESPR